MPKILYKARNARGDAVKGFVDAPTAARAVAQLEASGLADVELVESPGMAELDGERSTDDARVAAFVLRVREKPRLATVLGEVARRARVVLAVDGALIVAGLASRQRWLAVAGALALLATFAVPMWRHRHSRWFDRFQRAMAFGNWREARAMFERLRRGRHAASVELQLPIYDAQLRVREGEPLEQALARVELTRSKFEPGQFEARIASVHSAAKDYDGFLACMRAACEAAPDDPSRQVDWALANARVGDLALADELLSRIDMSALQVQGRPFVWWARGLVELRNDRPGAQASLQNGVDGFLELASPAALSSLALCSGACAIAMRRAGDVRGAKEMVARVWPLLQVHADTRLRAEIEGEVRAP